MIPVAKPSFSSLEKKYLMQAIDSGWISSKGKFIEEFEQKFARKYGGFATTTSNGTTALHLALVALGIGPGDEVIVPSFTFIASVNVVCHVGAKPVLVDIEKKTWNIDPAKIEAAITKRTKAIIVVHIYGQPAQMGKILKIAKKHNLKIIEDCAEAQGAKANNQYVGTIGDIGCFSFFGNKIMTSGEGGLCQTKSKKLHDLMSLYKSHGMDVKKRYSHPVIGFNFRMTNLQAAVALGQLEQVDSFIKKRDKIRAQYDKYLSDLFKSKTIEQMPNLGPDRPVCWFYCILTTPRDRDKLMAYLEKKGVETRPFFIPVHLQGAYKKLRHPKLSVSEEIGSRGINLPTFVSLKDSEIKLICNEIHNYFKT